MAQMIASLSLDLDNKWSYLKTHGDRGWEEFPSYLNVVVPRFLDTLEKLDLRITVFVVGQDAAIESNHAVLRSIASSGHEIGNHSFHHEPWLHLYSPEEIEEEIATAEKCIAMATGATPRGFRGPGYSLSPAVIECLVRRGYRYDASTLPTMIGPAARAYYFFRARLSESQRKQRQRLFGDWKDGLRPIRPYWWQIAEDGEGENHARLLEIPVTTLPVFRVPIHFSYLLFLREKSNVAAWSYWRLAMGMCQATRVEPSLLLHPLDLLGGDEEPDLAFFPAMKMTSAVKQAFVGELLADFSSRFRVLTLAEHAMQLAGRLDLRVHRMASAIGTSKPLLADEMPPVADAVCSSKARGP